MMFVNVIDFLRRRRKDLIECVFKHVLITWAGTPSFLARNNAPPTSSIVGCNDCFNNSDVTFIILLISSTS